MSPISDAQKRATKKYEGTQEFIQFRVPKGDKGLYAEHAKLCGESLTSFIRRAITETMQRDLEHRIETPPVRNNHFSPLGKQNAD